MKPEIDKSIMLLLALLLCLKSVAESPNDPYYSFGYALVKSPVYVNESTDIVSTQFRWSDTCHCVVKSRLPLTFLIKRGVIWRNPRIYRYRLKGIIFITGIGTSYCWFFNMFYRCWGIITFYIILLQRLPRQSNFV